MTVVHAASDDTPGDYRLLPAADLKVRIYNAAVVPAADQAVALRAAASVLAAAGIGTTWLLCGNGASEPAAGVCSTPLDPSELSVRLVRLPGTASSRGELQLGYSLVDTTAGAGTLATIYADRVAWLAGEAAADMPTLVGFAIAHEIGHLLLGTNAHAGSGLMRAVWSRTELRRNDTADWLFGRSDAARLRASVRRLEGLRSSQPDFNAAACSASVDVPSHSAADTSECSGGGVFSIRAMAAGADRRGARARLHR
jgi:hypothetical protein